MFRLLRRLVRFCYHDRLRATWQKGYDVGLTKGYELGYKMAEADQSHKGVIIGSQVDEEIAELLRNKGMI